MDVSRIFTEHHLRLQHYLMRFTGDTEMAQDAVQEAFVRLMEAPPRTEYVRAWLYRVATNALLESMRTRNRRTRLLGDHPFRLPIADPPESPDAAAERNERERKVREALEGISPRDKMVLLMRAEGFSYREIAEAVGSTTSSVGTFIARAAERLSARLSSDEASHD